MEAQNKYLVLARRAREEGNAEDARRYYDILRTEDPDNAEAKFFYSYYRMMDGTNGEAFNNFVAFCKGVGSTVSLVQLSDDTEAAKKAFLKTIFDCVESAMEVAAAANRAIGGRNGIAIGDTYCNTMNLLFSKAMDESDPELVVKKYKFIKRYEIKYDDNTLKNRYLLGDEIVSKYANMPQVLDFALNLWKECIATQQREYNTAAAKNCAGMAEQYAEKIKKYDPAYVMPKKASGCISKR